eukprot:13609167-Alexandrium_andersonii.AAC.1
MCIRDRSPPRPGARPQLATAHVCEFPPALGGALPEVRQRQGWNFRVSQSCQPKALRRTSRPPGE